MIVLAMCRNVLLDYATRARCHFRHILISLFERWPGFCQHLIASCTRSYWTGRFPPSKSGGVFAFPGRDFLLGTREE